MPILLMVSSLCCAQNSNQQLYQAYLVRDMDVWQRYIASARWDTMSTEEQKQLLNYEYGFAAYCISHDGNNAEGMLKQFEQHLHASKGKIADADYYAYLSGLYSYKLSFDKTHLLKYSSGIFDNIKHAAELQPNNPFVLSMQGNVEFYSPFGSKKKALEYYTKAETNYRQLPNAQEVWNLRAVQMTIVQCLAKMNRVDDAKQRCEQYLQEEPGCLIFQQLMSDLNNPINN